MTLHKISYTAYCKTSQSIMKITIQNFTPITSERAYPDELVNARLRRKTSKKHLHIAPHRLA